MVKTPNRPEEKETLESMIYLRGLGASPEAIATKLNAKGIPTRMGKHGSELQSLKYYRDSL